MVKQYSLPSFTVSFLNRENTYINDVLFKDKYGQ